MPDVLIMEKVSYNFSRETSASPKKCYIHVRITGYYIKI